MRLLAAPDLIRAIRTQQVVHTLQRRVHITRLPLHHLRFFDGCHLFEPQLAPMEPVVAHRFYLKCRVLPFVEALHRRSVFGALFLSEGTRLDFCPLSLHEVLFNGALQGTL